MKMFKKLKININYLPKFENAVNILNKNYLTAFTDIPIIRYPTLVDLSYAWSFGFLVGICLVIQILTGLFLAMHYTPHVDLAFSSVAHIMVDVHNGWLIRHVYANVASMFFIFVYTYISRGPYYSFYRYSRQFLWCYGVVVFILMMETAFMEYNFVFPWGQMVFWGADVITSLVAAVPLVGNSIVEWLWGSFIVDNAILNRFFSLHFFLFFLLQFLFFFIFFYFIKSGC